MHATRTTDRVLRRNPKAGSRPSGRTWWVWSCVLAALGIAPGATVAGAASLTGFSMDAGATLSRFGGGYGDAAEKSRTSPTLGASMHIGIGASLSLRPGLAWVSKGGKVDTRFTFTSGSQVAIFDVKETWVVECLEAPVLLHWESPGESFIKPFVALGPGFSWRLASDLRDASFVDVTPAAQSVRFANIFEDIDTDGFLDRMRTFDVDAIVGTGVALGRGRTRATIEARYLHGLRDVAPSGSFLTAYHRAFTLTAGVEIR